MKNQIVNKFPLLIFLMAAFFANPLKAQNTEPGKSINAVISNYLALKNTLISSDGNAAKPKATNLLESINGVTLKGMTAVQSALWKKYLPKLQFDSRHISEVTMIAHQREHFASLSENLYQVIKRFGINYNVLYYQYCTMRSTYFLSETAKGKDPYMGMDGCSKVKEVLHAAK